MKHLFVFSLLLANCAPAQNIGYGLRVGVPLNDAFDAVSTNKVATNHLVVGPTLEVRLPLGFAVQADLLYTRHKLANGSNSAGSWEFPLLAKYRMPGVVVRPFVEGGVSFQRIGDVVNLITTQAVDHSRRGFVLGAGIEAKLTRFRISPELRWTRWGEAKFTNLNPITLLNASSQGEFLVGFTF